MSLFQESDVYFMLTACGCS